MPAINLVVAAASNGVIGQAGGLPWRLPADLAHFKRLTLGHPILMGRRTWQSIGRALPGRRNLVISRSLNELPDGVERFESLDSAIASCDAGDEIMIIGGAALYAAALPLAQRIYLTRVQAEIEGDTVFPSPDSRQWRCIACDERPADADNAHALRFETLERI